MSGTVNITYNQIKDIFKSFSSRHLQLNDFYFGELSEIGNSQSFNYPLLAVFPDYSRIIDGETGYNTMEHSFNVVVCDLVKSGEENQIDVLSDSSQILFDLVAEIEQDEWYSNNNILLKSDAILNPFYERWDDLVGGWNINIKLFVPNRLTNCLIPTTAISKEDILNFCINKDGGGQVITSLPFSAITSTPTTLSGYGITDAYTQIQIDTLLSGLTTDNFYTTGATLSASTAIFSRNDGVTYNLDLSGLSTPINIIHNGSFEGAGTISSPLTLTPANSYVLSAASWTALTYTLSTPGVTSDVDVMVNPSGKTDAGLWSAAGIWCTAQATDQLIFVCSTTPTSNINIKVKLL